MFYTLLKNKFFSDKKKILDGKDVCYPTVFDTEYYTPPFDDVQYPRLPITSQFKNIFEQTGHILVKKPFIEACEALKKGGIDAYNKSFNENDFKHLYRHPVTDSGVDVVDFLRLQGFDVSIKRDFEVHTKENRKKRQRFVWIPYVHFGVADIPLLGNGTYQEDVVEAFKKGQIVFYKRLTTKRHHGWNAPWIITINGIEYRFVLKIIDTNALAGNKSLNDLQELVGTTGVVKGVLAKGDIENMHLTYLRKPAEFDKYALGDLEIDNILLNFTKQNKEICNEIDIAEIDPVISLGSTVSMIFREYLLKETGLNSKEFTNLIEKATPSYLQKIVHNDVWRLSKCVGGRAYNAKPIVATQQGRLIDKDLSGAYTGSMKNLVFPVGNPVVATCKDLRLADFITFIEKYGLPRVWFGVIDLPPQTNGFSQDLIPSWHSCSKNMFKKTDSQGFTETGEVDLKSGETHILSYEIINGVITSDILDTLKHGKPRSYKILLKQARVKAFIFYPRVCEVKDAKDLSQYKSFKTRSKKITVFNPNENYAWHGVEMKGLIQRLHDKRVSHPKNSPMNTHYKLILNTIYGSSVSPFFKSSNMVFGNNITGLIRSIMYLVENGCQMQGTITDGHTFDIDKVLHRKNNQYLNCERMSEFYKTSNRDIYNNDWGHIKPLNIDNKSVFDTTKDVILKNELLTIAVLKHVKNLFPKAEVLNDTNFEFEIKAVYEGGAYNGTGHYALYNNDKQVIVKNRGVETKKDDDGLLKRPYTAFANNDFDYEFYKQETAAAKGLDDIYRKSDAVNLYPPYVKKSLLKPKMFRNRGKAFANSSLIPGDEFLESKMHRYFVSKQFHWHDKFQYKSWKKDATYLINKYGYSFELFFLNEDGTLDYQKMCIEVDKMVSDGVISPLKYLDKNNNLGRNIKTKTRFKVARDNFSGLKILKEKLNILNGFTLPEGVIEQYQDYDEYDTRGFILP